MKSMKCTVRDSDTVLPVVAVAAAIRTMRIFAVCGLLLIALVASGCAAHGSESARETISLDRDWRFHLGDMADAVSTSYDDRDWRTVDVPHDYAVEADFTQKNPFVYPGMNTSWYALHGFLPIQPAVYRKTIDVPPGTKGKHLWLEFDGVFSNSRYWLNGREIGSQYSGYTRSRFDVTEAAAFGGQNTLEIEGFLGGHERFLRREKCRCWRGIVAWNGRIVERARRGQKRQNVDKSGSSGLSVLIRTPVAFKKEGHGFL